MRAQSATLFGSVAGGVLASACCIGPVVFALLGISGAALARGLEPFRPYLLVMTYGLLGGAFYLTYRPQTTECGPGNSCGVPRVKRAAKVALWLATFVVVLSTSFPLYAEFLPF